MSTNGHIAEVKVITTRAPEGEAEVCPAAPLARSQFPRVDDPGHSCLLSPCIHYIAQSPLFYMS